MATHARKPSDPGLTRVDLRGLNRFEAAVLLQLNARFGGLEKRLERIAYLLGAVLAAILGTRVL